MGWEGRHHLDTVWVLAKKWCFSQDCASWERTKARVATQPSIDTAIEASEPFLDLAKVELMECLKTASSTLEDTERV